MRLVRRQLLTTLGASTVLSAAPRAFAQSGWPNRPIKLILPFGPGSASDVLARSYSEPLSQKLGQPIVIDYKPGASIDTKNWASDRVTEPQLPIYAAIAEHPNGEIAGVAFGQVHLSGMAFKGIGQDDHLLPNVHGVTSPRGRRLFDAERFPDWESVLTHWRQSIQRIAREVRDGDAAIRVTREADLQHCDVRPLLRMAERERQWEEAQHAKQDLKGTPA